VKRLIWVGKSYQDLREFPSDVRHAMGYALYAAQIGKMHEHAKVLSGMGSAKVIEIRENDRSGTYRVIYTIEMKDFVFVLHAFQKKSKSGIATPKQELELLKDRLKEAKVLFKGLMEKNK
jgi:phage-related protein